MDSSNTLLSKVNMQGVNNDKYLYREDEAVKRLKVGGPTELEEFARNKINGIECLQTKIGKYYYFGFLYSRRFEKIGEFNGLEHIYKLDMTRQELEKKIKNGEIIRFYSEDETMCRYYRRI